VDSIFKHTHPGLVFAGWLIDGTGGPIRKGVLLRIRGGRLASIDPVHADLPPDEPVLDLSSCTLLPGFVDAHIHLSMSGTSDPQVRKHQLGAPFEDMEPVMERHLREHLAQGVIALRDGGDRASHVLRYRETRLPESGIPLHLRSAGRAWHAPGRYGRLIGRSPREGVPLTDAVALDEAPVDHVKIVNSGLNSLVRFGEETRPQFGPEELRAAAAVCKRRGLPVMVHANGREPVRQAVEAGCDSIEHGFFMSTDNLRRMADRGTVWVPTACTMSAYARTLPAGAGEAAGAERNLDHQLEQIHEARRAGVSMALGTDSGSLGVHHGRSVAEELGLFLEAGMTVEEAIACATRTGASLLGLAEDAGRLVPGMPASLIAAQGSPDCLPRSVAPPLAVYIRGALATNPMPGPNQSS
jgi:imidazolonepropionase-like amidohydrolase